MGAVSGFSSSSPVRMARSAMKIRMGGESEAFVPDMPRRSTMNAILVGSVGVSVLGLAVPYLSFFVPPGSGGGGGGTVAKDALGDDVTVA